MANHVSALALDSSERIWIGTPEGVCYYDPERDIFRRISATLGYRIASLAVDGKGLLWIGTIGKGLFHLDPTTGNLFAAEAVNKISLRVWKLKLRGNQILAGTNAGLIFYDPSKKLSKLVRFTESSARNSNVVWSLWLDSDGLIWVGTWNLGLFCLDPRGNIIQSFRHDANDPTSLSADRISAIARDNTGRLWVGTHDGLGYLSSGIFVNIQKGNHPLGIRTRLISTIFQSSDQTLWFGGLTGGLFLSHPFSFQFGYYHHGFDGRPLADEFLSSVQFDAHGGVWLTSAKEIIFFNPEKRQTNRIPISDYFEDPQIMIGSFCLARDRILWVGTSEGFLLKFALKPEGPHLVGKKRISTTGIITMLETSDGRILVGTNGGGIIEIEGDVTLSHMGGTMVVFCFMEISTGEVYVGTRTRGVFSLDAQNQLVQVLKSDAVKRAPVSAFLEDPVTGHLVVGTRGKGLFRFSRSGVLFEHLFKGLASLNINGLLMDQAGNTWISTEQGLSRVSASRQASMLSTPITNFDRLDGIQDGETFVGSFDVSPKGLLVIAGTNGINLFDPLEITPFHAPVELSQYQLSESSRKLDLNGPQKLHLSDRLVFDYFLTDFWNAELVKYEYQFNEGGWLPLKQAPLVFSELRPGDYRLHIRGFRKGGWHYGAPIEFEIPVAVWQHPLILSFYGVLVATLIAMAIFYQRRASRFSKLLLNVGTAHQKERLEALGKVAGCIAHDFNSLLASILGFNSLAIGELRSHGPATKYLREVNEAGKRAQTLVKQILIFSGKGTQARDIVCAHQVVASSLALAKVTIPPEVHLTTHLSKQAGHIRCCQVSLGQIVSNLVQNAVHAVANRNQPHLIINLSHVTLNQDEFCMLRFRDNGKGIPKSISDRIFDPFFTTKQQFIGTGMGLSVVHGIVSALNGSIEIDSEVGVGTDIRVFIPTTLEPLRESRQVPTFSNWGRGQRVLVLDDDRNALKLGIIALRKLGYCAIGIQEPQEALREIKKTAFDLIITDWSMGAMTGGDFLRTLRKRNLQAKVMLWTANIDLDRDHAAAMGFIGFLPKPFDLDQLAEAVAKAV